MFNAASILQNCNLAGSRFEDGILRVGYNVLKYRDQMLDGVMSLPPTLYFLENDSIVAWSDFPGYSFDIAV
jgi:hypothetical protein